MSLKLLLAFAAVGAHVSAGGASLYVDCRNLGKAGMDGSEARAFGTVQEAVDAIPDGSPDGRSTIFVLPGDYDTGVTNAWIGGKDSGRCRVFVDRKSFLTIRARDGQGTVRIHGAHDATADGLGAAAIRCVASNRARGLRLVDLTLLNGATAAGTDETNPTEGAAMFCSVTDYPASLIGCVVSNCVARYGVVYRGNCFRTLISDNRGYEGGIVRQADLYSCVLTRNVLHGSAYSLCNSGGSVIGCTVVGNASSRALRGVSHVYNTLVSVSAAAGNAIVNATASDGNVTDETDGPFQAVAPIFGDMRLLPACAASVAGRASHLDAAEFAQRSDAAFPEEELRKDFFGVPFGTGESIVAGAVNATVAPASGAFVFRGLSSKNRISLSGFVSGADGIYAFATNYPVQWVVSAVLPEGTNLFGYAYSDSVGNGNSGGRYRFPQMDGSVRMMPPADTALVATNTLETSLRTIYVSASADDSVADGSLERPYGRLNSAAAAVQGETRVIVRLLPGTYADEGDFAHHWGMDCRLWIPGNQDVRWIGEHGAMPVRIEGRAATNPTNAARPGCGEDAMRILAVFGGNVQFQNITFANGFTLDADASNDGGHGGLSYHNGDRLQFHDCVITNCGGACEMMTAGSLVRCRVVDCRPGWKVMEIATDDVGHAIATYFSNVRAPSTSPFSPYRRMTLMGCTVTDSLRDGKYGLVTDSGDAVFACVLKGGLDFKSTVSAGNVIWDYANLSSSAGLFEVDPLLVPGDEPSVFARSEIWGKGAAPSVGNAGSTIHWFASGDIDGASFDLRYGSVMPGARQAGEARAVFVDAPNGGIAVGGRAGVVPLADMDELEVAMAAAKRPCAGVEVNGVAVPFGAETSLTMTAAEIVAAGGMTFRPVFTNEWHVSPCGSDAALGFTAGTAFLTLTNAMAHAVRGDVVRAAPGVYAEGAESHDASMLVKSRVVVPAGVALVSDGGADVTFIEGASDPDDAAHGCGPRGIRCAVLNGEGARIDGFTLRGGRVRGIEEGNNHYNRDFSGGGVCGLARSCLVENCVITNCGAFRGGGARYATLRKCRIEDCLALGNSAALGEGSLIGSLVARNRGEGSVCYDLNELADCTFADNTNLSQTSSALAWRFVDLKADGTGSCARNVAVRGKIECYAPDKNAQVNVFTTEATGDAARAGVTVVSDHELGLDASYRPVVGRSALVDAVRDASADVAGFDYAEDLTGFQRIMNGFRDVGALEGDWRPAYRADLTGSRMFTVSAADADVVETAARAVRLPNGTSVTMRWTADPAGGMAHCALRTSVHSGELSVWLNGDLVRTVVVGGDDPVDVGIDTSMASNELVFAYSGEGYADLLQMTRTRGTLMVIR